MKRKPSSSRLGVPGITRINREKGNRDQEKGESNTSEPEKAIHLISKLKFSISSNPKEQPNEAASYQQVIPEKRQVKESSSPKIKSSPSVIRQENKLLRHQADNKMNLFTIAASMKRNKIMIISIMRPIFAIVILASLVHLSKGKYFCAIIQKSQVI